MYISSKISQVDRSASQFNSCYLLYRIYYNSIYYPSPCEHQWFWYGLGGTNGGSTGLWETWRIGFVFRARGIVFVSGDWDLKTNTEERCSGREWKGGGKSCLLILVTALPYQRLDTPYHWILTRSQSHCTQVVHKPPWLRASGTGRNNLCRRRR